MLEDKIYIYKPEWVEVVFNGRNKKYGAYQLRKDNPRTITRSFLYATAAFVVLLCSPMIYGLIKDLAPSDEQQFIQTEVELMAPPPVDKNAPPPPPPPPTEPPPPKTDQIKFPPPVVKPDDQVVEEEVPTVEDLTKADPGQKTQEGDPNADVVIDEPVGDGPKDAQITEDNSVMDVAFVEQQPEFPGGQDGFAKHIQRNLRYPPLAKENNIQGRVYISFVVERDGSLTDIKVERGIGGGCDEEAIRVLKMTRGWKPGVQNGRPVRVKFTLPIAFQLSQD